MVGNLEVLCCVAPIVAVDVATVDGQHHVVKLVVRILGHLFLPYSGWHPFVAVAVKHQRRAGIGHFVYAVNEVIVGIILVVFEALYLCPEVTVAIVVLILHHVFVEGLVVVPGGHENHTLLKGGGKTENHGAVSLLHCAHLGHPAGIVALDGCCWVGYGYGLC